MGNKDKDKIQKNFEADIEKIEKNNHKLTIAKLPTHFQGLYPLIKPEDKEIWTGKSNEDIQF